MKKAVKKILLTAIMCLTTAFLFSEDWFVCLGAFNSDHEAQEKVSALAVQNVKAYVKDFKTTGGSTIYRVLYAETIETLETAHIIRNSLIKNLGPEYSTPDKIWFVSVSQNIPEEIKSKRNLTIKDSTTGIPVDSADVNIDRKWNLKTDTAGVVFLPYEIPDGEHSMIVTKGEEYIPVESTMNLSSGKISTIPQVSIPKKVDYNRIQIVLEWGEYPSDLDSHLISEEGHVYFSNKIAGKGDLDVDDTTSYGPETITIREPDPDKVYHYFVHNYSDRYDSFSRRLSNSCAKVSVFVDNEFKCKFEVTPEQEGLWWHVFDITGQNEITTKDIVSNLEP